MKTVKGLVDKTFWIYLLVGFLNFVLCSALMFLLYNCLHVSEHLAPVVNYTLGSVIWFFSCRYLVFRDQRTTWSLIARFALEVLICYGISYYIIGPVVGDFLLESPKILAFFDFGGMAKIEGNCSMTVGMIAYAVLNYFGQRYYVFSPRFSKK